jgi:hypothetical protein
VWGVSFLFTVALHWPIDDRLWANLDADSYTPFRGALNAWVEYTLPLIIGGALALALLRPRALRIPVALGFVVVSALSELVILPAYTGSHSSNVVVALIYAFSAAALAAAWLVIRGRSAPRVVFALVTVLPAFAGQFVLNRLLSNEHAYDALNKAHGTVIALLTFLVEAVAISIAAWLAAIGAGTPRALPAAPAGYPGYPPPPPPPAAAAAPAAPAGWRPGG